MRDTLIPEERTLAIQEAMCGLLFMRSMPEFTGDLAKQKDHWNAFVAYKSSELGIRNVEKAKENASKKVYHHTLGPGGYKLAKPKWEKMEQDLIDKGITPATIN